MKCVRIDLLWMNIKIPLKYDLVYSITHFIADSINSSLDFKLCIKEEVFKDEKYQE